MVSLLPTGAAVHFQINVIQEEGIVIQIRIVLAVLHVATTTARRIFLQREVTGLALQIAVKEDHNDYNAYLTWILYRFCVIYYTVFV